jgi:hypothetical protein
MFAVQKGMFVRYTGTNAPMSDWRHGEVVGLLLTGRIRVDFGNGRFATCDPENLEPAK